MNKIIQTKLLQSNTIEDVIEYNGHFYVVNKHQKICVMPYTLEKGMLNKIGVLKYVSSLSSNLEYSLINGIVTIDDETDLVAANRIMFELTNTNAANANIWMYLGKIKTSVIDDLGISLYCVNITDLNLSTPSKLDRQIKETQFKLINSNDIIATDDSILLSSYLRLFQFFYINSLNK
jgi:hypothetical protein